MGKGLKKLIAIKVELVQNKFNDCSTTKIAVIVARSVYSLPFCQHFDSKQAASQVVKISTDSTLPLIATISLIRAIDSEKQFEFGSGCLASLKHTPMQIWVRYLGVCDGEINST